MMPTLDNFDVVLAAAKGGDENAASVLFRSYHPILMRYLRSQERRVAEDLAAEVWLAAASSLQAFEGDEVGYRAWLFTVARRRVSEHRRRSVRRRTDVVDPVAFDETSAADDPAATALDSVDAQHAIDLITRHLSDDQAEVLILRVVADLSARQVAELMGRPVSWVRVTQHRALQRLDARLGAKSRGNALSV